MRIGVAGHVLVFEAAQHQAEGVDLAHAGKETASEAVALLDPLADGGDVDDLEAGVDDLAALAHLREGVDPRVGDVGDARLGLDSRERMRRRRRRCRRSER